MACTVHYDDYVAENEQLSPLNNHVYERLVLAADCRRNLGGGNLHEVQSSQISNEFVLQKVYERH